MVYLLSDLSVLWYKTQFLFLVAEHKKSLTAQMIPISAVRLSFKDPLLCVLQLLGVCLYRIVFFQQLLCQARSGAA